MPPLGRRGRRKKGGDNTNEPGEAALSRLRPVKPTPCCDEKGIVNCLARGVSVCEDGRAMFVSLSRLRNGKQQAPKARLVLIS